MCALITGPLLETVNVVLAMGAMVDLFGNSTIKFWGPFNVIICGTSDKRRSVSVAPVSPMVWMIADGCG
jgi:hypothetical protein